MSISVEGRTTPQEDKQTNKQQNWKQKNFNFHYSVLVQGILYTNGLPLVPWKSSLFIKTEKYFLIIKNDLDFRRNQRQWSFPVRYLVFPGSLDNLNLIWWFDLRHKPFFDIVVKVVKSGSKMFISPLYSRLALSTR